MTQKVYGMTDVIHEIKRIADALELVIQMVKKDQEETKARFEERWDKEDQEAAQ